MIVGMAQWRGHAVLQVGVPALEAWVRARTRHYDPRFVSADAGFRHAHITVLAPLSRWDEAAVAQIAGGLAPFEYELGRLEVFPDGVVHLRPHPDDGFRQLTRAVWAAHPDVVPFGAPTPTPHLTLDRLADDVSVASTLESLGGMLPARGRADALELVWYEADKCHLIRSWPLGRSDP